MHSANSRRISSHQVGWIIGAVLATCIVAGLLWFVLATSSATDMDKMRHNDEHRSLSVSRYDGEPPPDDFPNRSAGPVAAGQSTTVPATTSPTEALPTPDLLRAMKEAYLEGNNSKLESLRSAAVLRSDLDALYIKNFYRDLVHGTHKRHDEMPTLEYAISDVLLAAWAPQADLALDVMTYATEVLRTNSFVEFEGHWIQGYDRKRAADPIYQKDAYQRPRDDLDTQAVVHLVESALRKTGVTTSESLPLVALFSSTKDYVQDRLAFIQIYACNLAVRLGARQNVDALWRLSQDAVIDEVRTTALEAYLRLGDQESIIELVEQWTTMLGDEDSATNVRAQLDSLGRSKVDTPTLVQITRAFFESALAKDIKWGEYSVALSWAAQSSGRFRATRDVGLASALAGERNPAMLAAWAVVLGTSYHSTNDSAVLQLLADRLHDVVSGQIVVRRDGELRHVVRSLALGYHNVLALDRKGQCFVPMLKGAYAVATPTALTALDDSLVELIATVRNYLDQDLISIEAVPARETAGLLEAAMPRLSDWAQLRPSNRQKCVDAWATLQVEFTAERLTELAETEVVEALKAIYLDALLAWQKQADRRRAE